MAFRSGWLVILAFLMSVATGYSETVFETEHGFSLTLSSDWNAIPDDVLEKYSESISSMYPNAPRQTYEYGYQPDSQEQWLTYPYILVQVKENGKISASSLKNYKKVQEDMESGVSEVKESFSEYVKDVGIEEPLFDEEYNTLFSVMSMDLGDVGVVKGLIAVVLTEKGTINIYGYAMGDDFDQYADLYADVARNISVNEDLKYRKGLFDSVPAISGIQWKGVVVGALIAALIAGVAMMMRKKD
jgi:hypothetical protein